MSTKLFVSLALCLGLSACLTEVSDDEEVLTGDDLETVQTDPGAEIQSELTGDPQDPNVVSTGSEINTCGGQPRLKADGPCLPK